MIALVSGVLWSAAHLFKRLAPRRERDSRAGRPLVALLLLVSVVMMVMGYQQAATTVVGPPDPGRRQQPAGLPRFLFYCRSNLGARVA